MNETPQDRWRRLHAAGMVRWMPGMAMAGDEGADFSGGVVAHVGIYREHSQHPAGWHHDWLAVAPDSDEDELLLLRPGDGPNGKTEIDGEMVDGFWPVPDFDDPATKGCIIAQAHEAYGLGHSSGLASSGWAFPSMALDAIERAGRQA